MSTSSLVNMGKTQGKHTICLPIAIQCEQTSTVRSCGEKLLPKLSKIAETILIDQKLKASCCRSLTDITYLIEFGCLQIATLAGYHVYHVLRMWQMAKIFLYPLKKHKMLFVLFGKESKWWKDFCNDTIRSIKYE